MCVSAPSAALGIRAGTIKAVTPWQKRARLLVAAIAVAVIAAVAYTMRPREAVAPPQQIDKPDPGIKVLTIGGNVIHLKEASQDLKIEFEKQATDQNDQNTLYGVTAHIANRGGRSYTITGNEAQVGKDESSFVVKGNVRMKTDDGLVANSQEATYTDVDKMVRAAGPVTFSRGRMTGSGTGFLYDEQRDMLTVVQNADVHFAPEGDQGPMDVTAGGFIYARKDRYMRFERTMHMDRAGQLIDADAGVVRLYPDRDDTDLIELRGNARVTGGGQMGALQSMSARDINLNYGEDGRTLENAVLAGAGAMEVAPKGGGATQRLAGDFLDLGLQPDGSVRTLNARDNVHVTLPAAAATGARTIRSTALSAVGAPEGIRQMNFSGGVEYREAATKTHPLRVARAQTLDATLDPAAGTLAEARFKTKFDFTEGEMRARADNAVYNVEQDSMTLAGTASTPHIENAALTVDANAIDVTLDPLKVNADGNVRSTMLPSKNAAASKRPALLGDKEPVQVVAAKLIYDESTQRAEYTGQAKLMQGDTRIDGDSLTLDEAKGDLIANGKVTTTLVIEEKDQTAGKAAPRPTIGRAGAFTYSDQTRTATYSTTAQLDGDQGNLRADRIEMKLAKDENTLDGLEANGQVTALVDRRTVTGVQLTYSPDDDKYVVTGAPVKMVDADCQETSGKTLTFWKASDRVIFDGNDEVRTQTKGGGKCPAVPPR